MGNCCWKRHSCENDKGNYQKISNQGRKKRPDLQKPVILFYNFQGPFSCEIQTNHPERFICFPKTRRKDSIKWEGEIKDNKICIGEHSYPYIFWESSHFSVLNLKPHFRFSGENMAEEVFEILLKLGLSEEESTNFVTYWIHCWQSQSSWLIHVLSQQTINELYPLLVSPKPFEIKRFYLLFGKDIDNLPLQPLHITKWQMTENKTVVEWGATKYYFTDSS